MWSSSPYIFDNRSSEKLNNDDLLLNSPLVCLLLTWIWKLSILPTNHRFSLDLEWEHFTLRVLSSSVKPYSWRSKPMFWPVLWLLFKPCALIFLCFFGVLGALVIPLLSFFVVLLAFFDSALEKLPPVNFDLLFSSFVFILPIEVWFFSFCFLSWELPDVELIEGDSVFKTGENPSFKMFKICHYHTACWQPDVRQECHQAFTFFLLFLTHLNIFVFQPPFVYALD